jgi:hypothetical protein
MANHRDSGDQRADLKGASAQQLTLTPMLADGTTVMTVAANMGPSVRSFASRLVRPSPVPAGFRK